MLNFRRQVVFGKGDRNRIVEERHPVISVMWRDCPKDPSGRVLLKEGVDFSFYLQDGRIWAKNEPIPYELEDVPQRFFDELKKLGPVVVKDHGADQELMERIGFDRDGRGDYINFTKRATEQEIKQAVDMLDHEDDSSWTSTGLPRLEVIQTIVGKTVTRRMVMEAVPGFKRKD